MANKKKLMNFEVFFLKSFRIFLFPFALLYGSMVKLRNRMFDKGLLKSSEFGLPLICIGNLTVGGTGKSPMTEYLVQLLKPHFKIATLSRGYKRKTKGYVLASAASTAIEIGDEPMQFHLKFPEVPVAVSEQRLVGIPQLLHDVPDLQAIILDDAFQHRAVKAGFNILLTEYGNMFRHDLFLPTGDLRDEKASYKRADIVIITKCPADLSTEQRRKLIRDVEPLPHQKVFFTAIDYGIPYHIVTKQERKINAEDEVLLVCAIANPEPLKEYLSQHASTYYQQDYRDHHIFTIDDLKDIKQKFNFIDADSKFVLTTEKDAVRFIKFNEQLEQLPLYVLPIRHKFLFEEGKQLDELVISFIRNFKPPNYGKEENKEQPPQ